MLLSEVGSESGEEKKDELFQDEMFVMFGRVTLNEGINNNVVSN